jgi:hypothetical protein
MGLLRRSRRARAGHIRPGIDRRDPYHSPPCGTQYSARLRSRARSGWGERGSARGGRVPGVRAVRPHDVGPLRLPRAPRCQENRSLRMRFDFREVDGEPITFDLKHFREWLRIWEDAPVVVYIEAWDLGTIWRLFEILRLAEPPPGWRSLRPRDPGSRGVDRAERIPSPRGRREPLDASSRPSSDRETAPRHVGREDSRRRGAGGFGVRSPRQLPVAAGGPSRQDN